MIRIDGLNGIYAAILAHSISPEGIEFITFEVSYPRIILSELNTHRMLPKNSASSRAIPFDKMVSTLDGMPVRFGQANPGMQDKGVDFDGEVDLYEADNTQMRCSWTAQAAWGLARAAAVLWSKAFYLAGFHKQVYNRLTEPFQMMKTVISGTEWNNFFWLRDDGAADPTLAELARCMREAKAKSTPFELQPGQWHLPYVDWAIDHDGQLWWKDEHGSYVRTTWEDLLKVSAARCAAVSFRNVDYGMAKCLEVFDRLVGDERKHASAFEHQATPMSPTLWGNSDDNEPNVNQMMFPSTWEKGVSHMDRKGQLWSGPLRGWVQFRKLIPGENKEG